jgi:hyperosmotically inducible protein
MGAGSTGSRTSLTMKKLLSCFLSALLLGTVAFTSACSATATRQSTGEYIDDTTITAKVKSAFVSDDNVKAMDVQVETFRGVVQLSGFVDTAFQKQQAETVARGVNGVRDVTNNIQLKANQ